MTRFLIRIQSDNPNSPFFQSLQPCRSTNTYVVMVKAISENKLIYTHYFTCSALIWINKGHECPLYPNSEHLQCTRACPLCARSRHWLRLFDHVIGAEQSGRWNDNAEQLRCFEIQHEFEPRRRLYRCFSWIGSQQYLSRHHAFLPRNGLNAWPIGHQSTVTRKVAE
jgi:hypothetical protein